jgi:hypothetical protein
MAKDAGEASPVVKEIEEWFARVPFETVREEFLAARAVPRWSGGTRRFGPSARVRSFASSATGLARTRWPRFARNRLDP